MWKNGSKEDGLQRQKKLSCKYCVLSLESFLSKIQVGTPKTHRRYLARDEGTYGPMPRNVPKGLLGMPFNTTVSTCCQPSLNLKI